MGADAGAGSEDTELAQIWREHRAQTLARVDAIEAALRAGAEGQLGNEARRQARREAHTLAGSVAFFGLHEAASLARAIEDELEAGRIGPETLERVGRLRAALAGPVAGYTGDET